MRIVNLFSWALIFILWACQSEHSTHKTEADSIFGSFLLPSTQFQINNARDTLLIGREGTKLFIPKNALETTSGSLPKGTILIELKEALSLENMVLGNLFTMSADGRPLESSGMIYINASQNGNPLKLNAKKTIRVELPNTAIRNGSKVFMGRDANGRISWTESHETENNRIASIIEQGQLLFEGNCNSCHSTNMRIDMTGPALGNVHLNRDRIWLHEFIRNSSKLMESGDLPARCIYDKYKSTMTDFEHLSEEEIDAILAFIENQSLLQQVKKEETPPVPECDTALFRSQDSLNRLIQPFVQVFNSFVVTDLGWANIDRFLDDPRTKARPFFVKIPNFSNVELRIVFKYRNSFLPAYKSKDNLYTFTHGDAEPLTPFPIGETAILIAMLMENGKIYLGCKEITIGDKEEELLELKEMEKVEIILPPG